jgi:DNA/RNA endonuclease YhcR with UshA esterase domain
MKLFSTFVVFAVFCLTSFGEEAKTNAPIKIPASEAKSNIGTNAIVTGKIAEVNKNERIIRLNFDAPFPKSTFTAVIFPDKMKLFPDVEKLQDKTVEVSGKIAAYRERPQIVLTSTNQLKIVERANEPEKK